MKDQHAQTFQNHLNAFTENNPLVKVLVTSRFNFYDFRQHLRGFDVYILQPLLTSDIEAYIQTKLGAAETDFRRLLDEHRLSEYLSHPYYLTRLVRFYREQDQSFPRKKSELFKRILFEQLKADVSKFNIEELQALLFPVAQEIAFCMTVSGKSALSSVELKAIVPNQETRKLLRHFCILNVNESATGTWSFEHKNLQEYLCASLLACFSFEKIHPLISFSFNRRKLLPRFLNTIAFLFEMLDKNSSLFKDLFLWIQADQPELFVRFEKEQLDKEKRQELFKAILTYYNTKNITVRISSNFSIDELAEFAALDITLIAYLGEQLRKPVGDQTAYDILDILARVKRPYLYRDQLIDLYFFILEKSGYKSFVKGECIKSIATMDTADKALFERILQADIDISDFEIRRQLMEMLASATYRDDFVELVLGSIPVYEQGQKRMTHGFANQRLIELLLSMQKKEAIKKLLQFCISHRQILSRHHLREIHFKDNEIGALFLKAAALCPQEQSLLRLVYRIFRSVDAFRYEEKWAIPAHDFFVRTCGTQLVFQKLYRYRKKNWRGIIPFMDEVAIDFLIGQYEQGALTSQEIMTIQNWLRWKNHSFAESFLKKFLGVAKENISENDDDFDYQLLESRYQEKNQRLLLNQSLFLEEADAIFNAIPQTNVSHEDLYRTEYKALRPYYHSIVKEAIVDQSISGPGQTITRELFNATFAEVDFWQAYVIEQIKDHLEHKPSIPLKQELLTLAQGWFIVHIQMADFTNAVRDKPGGGVTFNGHYYFLRELYGLLEVEMEDTLHLKLLEIDFSGIQSEGMLEGPAAKVVKQVKDRTLLKATILENIRSKGLPAWVLATHFHLCHQLQYQECLRELYTTIVSDVRFDGYSKRSLTDLYLGLGGEIGDFEAFLKVPTYVQDEDYLFQWEWYLVEKFAENEPNKAVPFLLEITNDTQQSPQGKAKAIEVLLQIGRPEALNLWATFIKTYHYLPSEQHLKAFQQFIQTNSDMDIITVLLDVLKYSYENRLFAEHSYRSIQEFVFSLVIFISSIDHATYAVIDQAYENLVEKYQHDSFVHQIVISRERFAQRFYESHEYEITVDQAVDHFKTLTR